MQRWTIGRVAKGSGVKVETVRYYEREGLLHPPRRSAAGYRLYEPDVVRRIGFIKQAQSLGFSLAEVAELLALRADEHGRCEDVRERTLEKVSQIEAKILHLQQMRAALMGLARECTGQGSVKECPILEAFGEPEEEVERG